MPYQPKKPCNRSNCPNLTHNRSGYCDHHQKDYRKQRDINRDTSDARGYTYRWQKVRKLFLTQHPLCIICQSEGVITTATIIDHIIPHKGNQDLFWDESNWQPLCKFHHDQKTGSRDHIINQSRPA